LSPADGVLVVLSVTVPEMVTACANTPDKRKQNTAASTTNLIDLMTMNVFLLSDGLHRKNTATWKRRDPNPVPDRALISQTGWRLVAAFQACCR
jgi:hypothetical protein